MRAGGRISLLGLLIIVGIGAAAYWGVIFGPAYLERFDVVDAVNVAVGRIAGGEPPEGAKENLIFKLNSIGTHVGPDEEGNEVVLPGLGVDEESVQTVYADGTAMVSVRYRKLFVLKPTANRIWDDFFVEATKKGGR